MSPERRKIIGNRKVEEYWWAGRLVTYVDNHLSQHSFDEAVSIVEMDHRASLPTPQPENPGTSRD